MTPADHTTRTSWRDAVSSRARRAERRARVTSRTAIALVAAAATVALAAACSAGPESRLTSSDRMSAMSEHAEAQAALSTDQLAAIAQVRAVTAQFHDTAGARAGGYTLQFPAGCIASPAGAQGVHYMNPGLVDTTVDLLHPELVMFEPQADGSMALVGVDYVVPVAQWTHTDPPTLLGVPFMRIDALGVWALHIWAWRPNPSGMFSMWNPNVSCTLAR